MKYKPFSRIVRRTCALLVILLASALIVFCSSCAVLGLAANAVPQYIKAKYPGLQNQSVGVMVWADRGVLIDWESIQLDLANAVQNNLQSRKAEELKGTTYPWKPASIVRYQRDHPGVDALPITDVAPKLQVSRLIYIEVQGLRTRSETAMELYRGQGVVSLKVIEVDQATGTSEVAFTEDNIQVVYPPHVPADGLPAGNDQKIYIGVVQALSNEVADRLTTHEDEQH